MTMECVLLAVERQPVIHPLNPFSLVVNMTIENEDKEFIWIPTSS